MSREIDIVIPAAGLGRRMKSMGSKSLIQLTNGETLIGRQVRICHEVFPLSKIVVVTGFEKTRLKHNLPSYVQCVENPEFEQVNVAHSLNLGLGHTDAIGVVVIYGDLIFETYTLKNFRNHLTAESAILVDDTSFKEEEVGVTQFENEVTQFSYGLETKWAQIAFLTKRELCQFYTISGNQNKKRFFGFEILNEILDSGGKFKAIQNTSQILEIDCVKDISFLNQFNFEDKQ